MRESFFLKPSKPLIRFRCKNVFVMWLFQKIWWRRFQNRETLKEVRGWRQCVIDECAGQRKVCEFLFKVPFTKGRVLW